MDSVAAAYVRLVLAVGQHDANYVDAYYGPDELKPVGGSTLREIEEEAQTALSELGNSSEPRARFLAKQLAAVVARVEMLHGRRFSFDEEVAALYDVVDAGRPESHYTDILSQLEQALP